MSSFVKRNQNTLSILRKRLIDTMKPDCVPGAMDYSSSRILSESDLVIPPEAFLNSISLKVMVGVGISIKRPLVEVREYEGYAVLGINLENNVNFALDKGSLAGRFKAVHKGPAVNPEKFSQELNKELGIYTGNDFIKKDNMTNLYPTTNLFKRAEQLCTDTLNNKCSLMMRPKEFPFMTESSFIPVMVFETETGKGYYFKSLGVNMSYKERHNTVMINEVSRQDILTAWTYAPWPLFLLYDGKYMSNLV